MTSQAHNPTAQDLGAEVIWMTDVPLKAQEISAALDMDAGCASGIHVCASR